MQWCRVIAKSTMKAIDSTCKYFLCGMAIAACKRTKYMKAMVNSN